MAYEDFFKSKFSQGMMIDSVLKIANKNAGLETEKNGVCQTMTLLWIIESIKAGSPSTGFTELMKHDTGTGVGAAFWTQVCGAQKGIGTAADAGLTAGSDLRDAELKLLAGSELGKKISSTLKGQGGVPQIEKLSEGGGPYFYFAVRNCWGKGGGHGIGLYRSGANYSLMDPNEGLATNTSGKFSDLLTALSGFYGSSSLFLYEIKS